jgi:predicted RNA-binding protein with RPS1 domain
MALTEGESERLIICNGFKDDSYIEAVILAAKLGRTIIPVVENFSELALILKHAKTYDVRPRLGVRVKLASEGAGRWRESSGEKSKFGLFVTFDGLEGLVHISEIAWGHVKNPAEYAQVGDKVQVKVIGVDGEKLSLSIKQLTKDPWEEIAERYPVGKKVQGTVVRFADYGAFIKLEKDINGVEEVGGIISDYYANKDEVLSRVKKK